LKIDSSSATGAQGSRQAAVSLLEDLRDAARRDGLPVSEWVRRALREARRREPQGDIDRKLRALREAMRHEGPTADIEQMLAEVEQGYLDQPQE
jgi:hypothetical protein